MEVREGEGRGGEGRGGEGRGEARPQMALYGVGFLVLCTLLNSALLLTSCQDKGKFLGASTAAYLNVDVGVSGMCS